MLSRLPFNLTARIFGHACSTCVLSLQHWKRALRVLAVSRYWRLIGRQTVYGALIIEVYPGESGDGFVCTNVPIIFQNGCQRYVRTVVIYATAYTNAGGNGNGMYILLSFVMGAWFKIATLVPLQSPWHALPPSMSIMVVESLFTVLPNLDRVFVTAADLHAIQLPSSCMLSSTLSRTVYFQTCSQAPVVMIKQLEEYATCELGYFPDITPEHRIIYQEIRPTANYFCLGTEYLEWLDNNIITRRRVINFACSEDQLANPDTGIGDNYFQQSQSTQHMVYCPRVLLVGASNELVVFELYRRVHLDSKN